jgi:MFS family permease
VKKHGSVPPGAVARYSLLGVTVLGTIANNIINVPLHAIAIDFDRSIATTVLSVSAFVLVLAVIMPVTGWVGDRWGQRRTLVVALILMVIGQLAAAMAPTLEFLIAARAVQGLACSAIPPMVMSMLVTFYPTQRLRMMGAWAAANGIGQALGPSVGGLISDLAGWRSIFVMMAVASLVVLVGILWTVPSLPGRNSRLHFSGALMLVNGVALLLVALTVLSLPYVPVWVSVLAAVLGVALLAGFVLVSRNNPDAMIPPHLIIESRFLRSCLAAFAQMFMLGTMLVVMPLYFTGPLALSSSQAGMLFFLLPLAMVLMAPMVSRLSDRSSPRLVLRIGMLVIIVGGLLTGVVAEVWARQDALWVISGMLLVMGAGITMVQTSAAAGATRSPAGARGAALGLFNMLRFSGTAAGTAWVALAYPLGSMLFVFVGAAVVAALGLMMSFVGPDPASVGTSPAFVDSGS